MPALSQAAQLTKRELFRMADQWETSGKAVENLVDREPLPGDPWEFATRCCITIDEEAANDDSGAKLIRRPFPDYKYLEDVIETCQAEPYLWIEKSSQILVSWALIAYFLHKVLTRPGYQLAYYCQTMLKAKKHIEKRFWRLYLSIPPEYSKPRAELKNGRLLVYHGTDEVASSFVEPMQCEQREEDQAADKMRSETWTATLMDESPFYPNARELHNTLISRTGRLVHVGTPNGQGFTHCIGYGDIKNPEGQRKNFDDLEKTQPMKGVWHWRRNGFACMRVMFMAHPDRDPDTSIGAKWLAGKTERTSSRELRREQYCDSSVNAGLPVWCDTERIDETHQSYQGWLPIIRAHDYSFLMSPCTIWQIRPDKFGEMHLHCLREIYSKDSEIRPHARKVMEECDAVFGKQIDWVDYGDYSGNTRTSTGVVAQEMASETNNRIVIISQPTGPGGVALGNSLFQWFISQGRVHIGPNCPMTLATIKHGYTRDEKGDPTQEHPYADFAHTCRYLAINTFQLIDTPEGSRTVKYVGPVSQQGKPGPSGRSEGRDFARIEGFRGAKRR